LGNFDTAIDFDELTGTTTSYSEHNFTLSSTGTILRDNTFSPAAKANASTNVFTLAPTSTANAFALYSIDLALTTGTQDVTFTGTTLNGGTVSHTVTVIGGTGFTRFNLPSTFAALSSVNWTPNAVLVDNIVPTLLTFGTPATAIAAIPTFTTSSNITFNTDTNLLTAGSINIDTDRNGTTDRTLGVGANLNQFGVSVAQITDGITQFRFAGDLIVPNNATIRATGTRGISLIAGNNVTICTGVSFDVSGSGTTAVAGGGSGFAGGTGGAGGAGRPGSPGGAGGGGGGITGGGGGGITGSAGSGSFFSGGSGTSGTVGTIGGAGINGGTGGTRGSNGFGNSGGASGASGGTGGAGGAGGNGGVFEGGNGATGSPGGTGASGSRGLSATDGNNGTGGQNNGTDLTKLLRS
jgi:hypothetical protein